MSLSKDISNWIKKTAKRSGAKGLVFGLSGGIDSACVAALSKMALGDNVLGLIMPCQSDSKDEEFARLVADKFKIKLEKIDLKPMYDRFVEALPDSGKMALANIKPRLRMITLYYFANKLNYLVVGTGNKSELSVGYFTKYGDGGVDILPLGGLLKTEIRQLAKELDIPDAIIKRVPTAGLWEGQSDESELGISYEELDKTIVSLELSKSKKGASGQAAKKVQKLINNSDHKRICIPVYPAFPVKPRS
jgi:NAD+ synthase